MTNNHTTVGTDDLMRLARSADGLLINHFETEHIHHYLKNSEGVTAK